MDFLENYQNGGEKISIFSYNMFNVIRLSSILGSIRDIIFLVTMFMLVADRS